jgi:sugar phosphate isomerase/epimerase
MHLSLMLSNLRLPFEQSLDIAAKLGIPAVHVSATGDRDPSVCSSEKRQELRQQLRQRDLVVSALSRWGGGVDLGDVEASESNIEDARRTLELSADLMGEDLGSGIWQAHIGAMPRSASGPRWECFLRTTETIAAYGEKIGACLAIETGPEPPAVVEKLISAIDSPGLRVNYDPANLIIWPNLFYTHDQVMAKYGIPEVPYDKDVAIQDFEPVEGVRRLGKFTVHTHAKDALIENGVQREVPLGEGLVDWPSYLRLLRESGYDGYLAIERETGADPVGDTSRAADFLREQLRMLDQDA